MASMGEIIANELNAEVTQAEIVPPETVLYDVSTDMKCLTVEELYDRLDKELDTISDQVVNPIDLPMIESVLRPKRLETILCYFCELYRRNVNHHEITPIPHSCEKHWWEINLNMPLNNRELNFYRGVQLYKTSVKKALAKIRLIKKIHHDFLNPIDEEINHLVDSILDANGNKISEFKEYLTEEHYRYIRAGIDVRDIKDQKVLLESLQKMKTRMKSKRSTGKR